MAKKIVSKEKVLAKGDVSPKITRGATPDEVNSDREPVPEKLSSKKESEDKGALTGPGGDYLEQYQYKKVNNVPTLGGVLTNPDKGSKAERMKNFLLGQKKISLFIPLEAGSSSKVPYSVNLNGYRLDLPTNTYIDVPEQVAEVVRDANKQTIAALNQFKQPE